MSRLEPKVLMYPWMEFAECSRVGVAPNSWFKDHRFPEFHVAKRICGYCTVKAECLDYAEKNDLDYGIYGGLTPEERSKIRRGKQ